MYTAKNYTPKNNESEEASFNVVSICGKFNHEESINLISTFFRELQKKISNNMYKKIYIDISELEFLDVFEVNQFVIWVIELSNILKEKECILKFKCNPNSSWQQTSMDILSSLNPQFLKHN